MQEIITPFTPEDAEKLLRLWAQFRGYSLGNVTELTRWDYAGEIFYSAKAHVFKRDTWYSADYRFHIHQDGKVTKFNQDGVC
jgi:hypothetical protein